jgi:hypothetical protein
MDQLLSLKSDPCIVFQLGNYLHALLHQSMVTLENHFKINFNITLFKITVDKVF